jgi:hypothetical protein
MSLTKVSYSMIKGASVNVLDYGSYNDGTHGAETTAAIRLAIAAAKALTQSGYFNSVSAGTTPTVFFPSGVYLITDYLTANTTQAVNYITFQGENSILNASAGVTVFGGVGYSDIAFSLDGSL